MANEQYGASGTMRARFISMQKVKGKDDDQGNPTYWAKVKISIGEKEHNVSSRGEAMTKLEGLAKGEIFPFWGMLRSSTNAEDKTYTNLQIGKVYDDERETQGVIYVTGEIKSMGDIHSTKDPKKVVGKFVDIDVTADEKYPTFVRLQTAYGTDCDLPVGSIVKVEAFPDKFGIWVFEGNVEKEKKSSMPEGAVFMGRRKPADAAAPGKPAAAGSKPASTSTSAPADEPPPAQGGFDDDIPW